MKNTPATAVEFAALAGRPLPAWADVTVQGNYLQLAVDCAGPSRDFGSFTGLKFDRTGSGSFTSPVDFLTPGNPFAFYSIGVDGDWAAAGGGTADNPFHASQPELRGVAGSHFILGKSGHYRGLAFVQFLSFGADATAIHSSITLQNISGAPLRDVVYGVGVDPDQDANVNGDFSTLNTIHGQGRDAGVSASGPASGLTITMRNTSGWVDTTASVSGRWTTNPYELSGVPVDDGAGDHTINLAYRLGTFAPGQKKSVGFDYAVSAAPRSAPRGSLLAGLGLLGSIDRRRGGGRS